MTASREAPVQEKRDTGQSLDSTCPDRDLHARGTGDEQPELLQVSLITADPSAAADFYAALFNAASDLSVNPQSYRGVVVKGGLIGFSAPSVRGRLNLTSPPTKGPVPTFDTGFFTVKLSCADAVVATTDRAEKLGAITLSPPAATPFGWFCAVLRDPSGHVFRLAALPN